jgi:hypothetical protein
MQPNNQLARAAIVDTTDGQIVSVMYNPEEMKLEQGNNFAEIGIPGLERSPVQYVRGRARTLSMELFFDSYESGQDVRVHTARIVRLLQKRPETQAPPVLIFVMGGFTFRSVLVDAGQRFTMFRSDGMPVRCYLSIRLQEYVSVSVDIERGLFIGSPTVSAAANTVVSVARSLVTGGTVHVSGLGETLHGLAAALLGDPTRWRDIAEANNVEDPFNLPVGTRLMIPPR